MVHKGFTESHRDDTPPVHDLAIHPRDNMIIIATHGRGIWVMDANPINGKDKIKNQNEEDREIE